MTDRERLIELIGSNSFCPNGITHCHQCRYYDVTRVPVCDGVAAIADYLIGNGVVVLQKGWKLCPECESKMEAE